MTGALLRRYATCRAEIVRNTFTGHAAVFGQYADLGSNLENLDDHAFDRVLEDPATDVRALFNHNPDMLLGRQGDGRPIQTHTSVARLLDVSPVTFPAYDGASTMLRAMSITIAPAGNRQRSQLIRARARVQFGRD
jgi:phage head maturation protease